MTTKKNGQAWILPVLVSLVLIVLFFFFVRNKENKEKQATSIVSVIDNDSETEASASEELQKDMKIVSTSKTPKLTIEVPEPAATPTGSLSVTGSIDNVKFSGDAGFGFLKSSTGAMIPVFYFHKNLLTKVERPTEKPFLYKSSENNIAPAFKVRGDYFYSIDAGKKIYPSEGAETIITGNAYLGIKPNGYEAWLAYELEEHGYMDVGGEVSLLYNQKTGGIDFAIKVKDWTFLE
ncbi:hypothetical protein EOL94_02770 [bacterium]|nr:hypothetical protein [bacterium]